MKCKFILFPPGYLKAQEISQFWSHSWYLDSEGSGNMGISLEFGV